MASGNQGSLVTQLNFPEFTDLITRNFYMEGESIMRGNAMTLFKYSDEQTNTGSIRRFQALDMERFALAKPEGAAAKKTKIGIGYYKDANAKRIAREINISWEMRRYNKEPEALQKITSLSEFCPNRYELDLTHRLTFATATSYTDMDGNTISTTTGDGLQLAYSAHTLPFSSTTYRNRISGDPELSIGALEAAEELADSNLYSDFGEKIATSWRYLVTSSDPVTCNIAKRILDSTSDYDYSNSGVVNTYKGKYVHVELPYLHTTAAAAPDTTKKRWWGIVSDEWQAYVGVWEMPNLKTPAEGNNGEDASTDDWVYGCRMSYAIETPGAKGIIMSCPTS